MSETDRSLVSVIIPVYNDPCGLSETVESILQQDLLESVEIIIVDNDSTDDTRNVAHEYADEHGRVFVAVEDDIQSSYAARNTGIARARGDVLVFIDADITADSDWLETIVSEIHGTEYLTYDVEVYVPEGRDTLVARYNAHTSFPIEVYAKERDFGGGGCIAVRRDVFEDVGLFDHRLISGGDAEFGNRVVASGREIKFTPDTRVYHPARTSLRSQIKKEIRVGRGFCQLQRYYPNRYGRPGIPPRPSGSGQQTGASELNTRERLVFVLLGYLFLGCRGLGYVLELVAGEGRGRNGDSTPPHNVD
ncbi:glycosyltransferase [Halorubrum cibi]|uniref:glycosyltransferase n=1 Tax=Halorubrum cibi TaxID=413815 RepID=UPI00115EFF6A|nr:glycosyltransferase [Halorubrum cibi]